MSQISTQQQHLPNLSYFSFCTLPLIDSISVTLLYIFVSYEMMKHKVFNVVMCKYNKGKYLNLLNVYNWDDGVYLVLQSDLWQTDILLSGRQDDLLIERMSSVQIQIYMDDLSGGSPNKLVDFHISYLSSHSFLRSSFININIFTSSARMFPSTLECPCTHHPCAHTFL